VAGLGTWRARKFCESHRVCWSGLLRARSLGGRCVRSRAGCGCAGSVHLLEPVRWSSVTVAGLFSMELLKKIHHLQLKNAGKFWSFLASMIGSLVLQKVAISVPARCIFMSARRAQADASGAAPPLGRGARPARCARTVDALALAEVGVISRRQDAAAEPPEDGLEVAIVDVGEEHGHAMSPGARGPSSATPRLTVWPARRKFPLHASPCGAPGSRTDDRAMADGGRLRAAGAWRLPPPSHCDPPSRARPRPAPCAKAPSQTWHSAGGESAPAT